MFVNDQANHYAYYTGQQLHMSMLIDTNRNYIFWVMSDMFHNYHPLNCIDTLPLINDEKKMFERTTVLLKLCSMCIQDCVQITVNILWIIK